MSDMALKDMVLDELEWDQSTNAASIGVAVKDGAVTLSGHVDTYFERYSAVEAAKRVRGVRAIANDIEVRPATVRGQDDAAIAERINHVLDWNVATPTDKVRVTVQDGQVTLSGEVEWQQERHHIESQIGHISGVRGIRNDLRIRSKVSPADLKDRIKGALDRSAEVEARGISVAVDGGTVTLSGRVRALYERNVIEAAVWKAPGVHKVIDNIAVG